MLQFLSPQLSDYKKIGAFFADDGEMSCEMNFINIYVWQAVYDNRYYIDDKTLIFKSKDESDNIVFSLPYGDINYGMSLIFEYCKELGIRPDLWAGEGKRLEEFMRLFPKYDMLPCRDNFDYIYKREALAELKGKKYHSKRNHIAAFTKRYDWRYETLTQSNKSDFLLFARKWYDDKGGQNDVGLSAEYNAISNLLLTEDAPEYKGAIIRVDGRVVAATLGSSVNSYTFDIHYEKADADYLGAYPLINREFAANELSDYEYINREDDLGIEGLRKAKMSYHPEILLKKYNLVYKDE